MGLKPIALVLGILSYLTTPVAWSQPPARKPASDPVKTVPATAPSAKTKPAAKILPSPPSPPRKLRDQGVKLKPRNPDLPPIELNPKVKAPPKALVYPTQFVLTRIQGRRVMLKFNSRNPRLELNPKAGMIIQLNATEPLQVQPSVFTGSTWPASNEAELTLSGIQVGPPNEILGEAAYTVCDIQSKECRKTKSPVSLIFEGP